MDEGKKEGGKTPTGKDCVLQLQPLMTSVGPRWPLEVLCASQQSPGHTWSWAQVVRAQLSGKYSLEKHDCAVSEGQPSSRFILQGHSFSSRLQA